MINYITTGGFKYLQDEFTYLKNTVRPDVTKLVSWAASLGDRSENADYQYGKKRLREIDKRLRFLGQRIDAAQVVDPSLGNGDTVQFGATVLVDREDLGLIEYQIVGVDETDTKAGRISWVSPLGKALLGKQVGDEVIIIAPKGNIEIEVVSVEYKEIFIPEYVYEGTGQHQSR